MAQCINPDIQFTDNIVGGPLYQGKLYFGIANVDPKTNPKQPFSDVACTVPISATQTLTDAGKPPYPIYLLGDYSLTVDDQYGAQVFSITSINELANSSNVNLGDALVAVKRTLPGAIATTVHEVIERMKVNVRADFGVVANGIANDSVLINAALASGASDIYFPDGTYKINSTLYYRSNQRLHFSPGAIFKPVPIGQFTILSLNGVPWGYAVFANLNWQATNITDENVIFDGLRIAPDSAFNGHAILSRKLRNLRIYNGYGTGIADYNATLACSDVIVENNWTDGATNCAYDFWEGCSQVTVQNNIARNCNCGVNWNSTDTYNAQSLAANHFKILGNAIFGGPAAAIFVSPLSAGSTIDNGLIQGNYINQNLSAGGVGNVPNGIVVQRSNSINIDNNSINQIGANRFPIIVTGDGFAGASDACQVTNNRIINSVVAGAAYIGVYGTNHTVTDNIAHNSSGAFGVIADEPSTVIKQKTLAGATTQILNQTSGGTPTTPAIAQRANTVLNRFDFDQVLSTPGVLESASYGLTATGTNLATAFQLTNRYSDFTTVAASTGAKLPVANILTQGRAFTVFNDGASALTLYAQTGDAIDGAGSQSIASGAKMTVACMANNVWKIVSA